jgi:hypothetical protein
MELSDELARRYTSEKILESLENILKIACLILVFSWRGPDGGLAGFAVYCSGSVRGVWGGLGHIEMYWGLCVLSCKCGFRIYHVDMYQVSLMILEAFLAG